MRTLQTYNGDDKIVYKELSYKLGGLFFKTHDILGRFAREKQYGDLFERLLQEKDFQYEREKVLSRTGEDIHKADFVIAGCVVVEFKVKPYVTREDYYQVRRYLEFSNLKLGIIVNFRQRYLKPKRVLNSKV